MHLDFRGLQKDISEMITTIFMIGGLKPSACRGNSGCPVDWPRFAAGATGFCLNPSCLPSGQRAISKRSKSRTPHLKDNRREICRPLLFLESKTAPMALRYARFGIPTKSFTPPHPSTKWSNKPSWNGLSAACSAVKNSALVLPAFFPRLVWQS